MKDKKCDHDADILCEKCVKFNTPVPYKMWRNGLVIVSLKQLMDCQIEFENKLKEKNKQFKKKIDKVQKQCYEADGVIDGITALQALRYEILEDEELQELLRNPLHASVKIKLEEILDKK